MTDKDAKECQCPERGDPHFYIKAAGLHFCKILCQCPERGDPHFYPY